MSRTPARPAETDPASTTPETAGTAEVRDTPRTARTGSHRAVVPGARRRPPTGTRRSAACLVAAAAGAVLINVMVGGQPAANAEPAAGQQLSVAEQIGLEAAASAPDDAETAQRLADLAASRSERDSAQAAAAQDQAAADQAVRDAQAAEAARVAAEAAAAEAARVAEEQARAAAEAAAAEAAADAPAAAAAPAPPAAAGPAASGTASTGRAANASSFKDYALEQLGGDARQFSCLENLWGKESGWNPNAQNPTSTAYGIPQFLNSTWAGTGIAKTSDGFRQIDAGLIYIDSRYGSPCGAWSHSQAVNWY